MKGRQGCFSKLNGCSNLLRIVLNRYFQELIYSVKWKNKNKTDASTCRLEHQPKKYKQREWNTGESADHVHTQALKLPPETKSSPKFELKVHIWKRWGETSWLVALWGSTSLEPVEIRSQDNSEALSKRLNAEFVVSCQNASTNGKEVGRR